MVVFIGFAYVGFVLAGVLGLGLSIGWVLYRLEYPELIIIVVPSVLYLFVSVARACWYVFPAREGVRLTRDEAPALFSTIDDLSAQFNATVHRVFINREFGAWARSTRRFGILGWRRNEIIVGYAKLCAHDVEDIRCTLAHEIAHIANAHTRKDFGLIRAKIAASSLDYRLRKRGHWAAPLFTWLLIRQVRTLTWVTRILARQHERDADEAAGRVVGQRAVRDALLRAIVRRRLTDGKFWPSVNARADREAEPPADILSGVAIISRSRTRAGCARGIAVRAQGAYRMECYTSVDTRSPFHQVDYHIRGARGICSCMGAAANRHIGLAHNVVSRTAPAICQAV